MGFALSYNMLCDVRRGAKLHALTRTQLSTVLHLLGSLKAEYR